MARRVLGAVGVVLAAVLIIVPTSTAARADSGTLTFIPGHGTAGTPIYTVLSGPCPKAATNLIGYVYGRGFPAAGAVSLANQSAPVNHDGAFGVELRDNLHNIAGEYGAKLDGRYRIVIKCIDNFNLKTFAEFSGTVTFDTPDHFTAAVPTTPPVAGVPVGYLALVFPQYKAVLLAQNENLPPGTQQPTARATASGSASAAAGSGPGQVVAAGAQPDQAGSIAHRGGGVELGWVLVGGIASALVAFAGAALALQRRPAAATAGGSGAARRVQWPDDAGTGTGPRKW